MKGVSTKQLQIANRAQQYKDAPLTNLHQYIDEELLEASYAGLNSKSASGIDAESYATYGERKSRRLSELLGEFKSGKYKAPPVRRVYIAKDKVKLRPIGIPTIEDKVVQNAVRLVMDPIYESMFADFSYGFRKGKSQHQALERIWHEIRASGARYILDADISDYFGSINFVELRKMLDQRVKDGVIRKQIDKWLKAGVLEGKQLEYAKRGTPQGGIISPLLSNIYLHEVLDRWYVEQVKPLLKGKTFVVRYADDFVIGFENKSDAERVMAVIFKRFAKYGLTLHPEKTKLIEFTPGDRGQVFTFLGFTHYWARSRRGSWIVKRRTSRKSMTKALKRVDEWLKKHRHRPFRDIIVGLNRKLRGHYGYYGITFNSKGITRYYYEVARLLYKWLNRRGGKKRSYDSFYSLVSEHKLLAYPRIVHSYL
jgi:group II intron reverse transcriptase/maturase